MFDKLKQLKNLRDQALQMKQMLGQETVEEHGAGGKIALVMNGNQEILSLKIDDELLLPEKKEELQNELMSTFQSALKKVQRIMAEKMQGLGGLEGLL